MTDCRFKNKPKVNKMINQLTQPRNHRKDPTSFCVDEGTKEAEIARKLCDEGKLTFVRSRMIINKLGDNINYKLYRLNQ